MPTARGAALTLHDHLAHVDDNDDDNHDGGDDYEDDHDDDDCDHDQNF